jgi:hypothetical protein
VFDAIGFKLDAADAGIVRAYHLKVVARLWFALALNDNNPKARVVFLANACEADSYHFLS